MSDEKVTIVNVDSSGHKEEKAEPSWYNKVSAERIDRWRIIPRLLMLLYGIAFYKCMVWFMELPEPTLEQSGLVSIIVGAGAAWFGLYAGTAKDKINSKG